MTDDELLPIGHANQLQWGAVVPSRMRVAALEWHAVPVRAVDGVVEQRELQESVGDHRGVYAFEGKHDAHPAGAVLYIGQARGSDDTAYAPLKSRIAGTFKRFAYRGAPRGRQRLFADCWDLVFHWAKVGDSLIDDIEAVLIRAHAPPFNAQEVRGALEFTDLLVLNAGAKGRLLPMVCSLWHADAAWPNPAD